MKKDRLPEKLKCVFIISFLQDFSYYVYLSVFALFLNRKTSLLNTSIIIAITNLVPVFAGFFSDKIERKMGTFRALILSFLIWTTDILLFVFIREFTVLVFVALLHGFSQMISKPILKTMYSKCQFEMENGTEKVHRVRYIEICVAGLTGPVVGGVISNYLPFNYCFFISFLFSILLIVLLCHWKRLFSNESVHISTEVVTENSIQKANSGLLDFSCKKSYIKLFISYIVCGTLIYTIFVQFESVYSLVLDTVFQKPALIFSYLISLNSLWGIVLQLIIVKSKLFEKLSVRHGLVFFQLGFLLFALSFRFTNLSLLFLFIGVFVYSIGEVITIPGLEIEIDKIIPEHRKTLYFGLVEIRGIGFVVGPVIMSKILISYNAFATCIFSVIVLSIVFIVELFNSLILKRWNNNTV